MSPRVALWCMLVLSGHLLLLSPLRPVSQLVPLHVTWCVCLVPTSSLLVAWSQTVHPAKPAMVTTKPSVCEEPAWYEETAGVATCSQTPLCDGTRSLLACY